MRLIFRRVSPSACINVNLSYICYENNPSATGAPAAQAFSSIVVRASALGDCVVQPARRIRQLYGSGRGDRCFHGARWDRAVAGAAWFGAIILAMGTQAYGEWIYRPTDVWLKPLLALFFAVWLVGGILWPRAA